MIGGSLTGTLASRGVLRPVTAASRIIVAAARAACAIGDPPRMGESGGVTSVLEEDEGVALFAFPFPSTGALIFLFFLFSTRAFLLPLLGAPLLGAGGAGRET